MDGHVESQCLMTTRAVARYLCVVPKTVHRWRRRRGLPFYRITRGALRYDHQEVQCWLARRRAQRRSKDLIRSGWRAKGAGRR